MSEEEQEPLNMYKDEADEEAAAAKKKKIIIIAIAAAIGVVVIGVILFFVFRSKIPGTETPSIPDPPEVEMSIKESPLMTVLPETP